MCYASLHVEMLVVATLQKFYELIHVHTFQMVMNMVLPEIVCHSFRYIPHLSIIAYVCICKVFYDFNVSSFRRDLVRARTITTQVCMDKGVIV